jgi:hypothetical protein
MQYEINQRKFFMRLMVAIITLCSSIVFAKTNELDIDTLQGIIVTTIKDSIQLIIDGVDYGYGDRFAISRDTGTVHIEGRLSGHFSDLEDRNIRQNKISVASVLPRKRYGIMAPMVGLAYIPGTYSVFIIMPEFGIKKYKRQYFGVIAGGSLNWDGLAQFAGLEYYLDLFNNYYISLDIGGLVAFAEINTTELGYYNYSTQDFNTVKTYTPCIGPSIRFSVGPGKVRFVMASFLAIGSKLILAQRIGILFII